MNRYWDKLTHIVGVGLAELVALCWKIDDEYDDMNRYVMILNAHEVDDVVAELVALFCFFESNESIKM